MNTLSTRELIDWLNTTLTPERFRDYCPNGLQVQGSETVRHVVTGVTASRALLEAAIEQQADTVLVHHGWFWKNEDPRIVGPKRARLALTLANNLNVIGYHLPLDAHPELGNNAQLGLRFGFEPDRTPDGNPRGYGEQGLVWAGAVTEPVTLGALTERIESVLQRTPVVIGNPDQRIERAGWCTGGAQGYFQTAIDAGVHVFITGEISEPCYHLACETGVAFIAAGHHATERYGIKALGDALQAQLGVNVSFIDLDNPA